MATSNQQSRNDPFKRDIEKALTPQPNTSTKEGAVYVAPKQSYAQTGGGYQSGSGGSSGGSSSSSSSSSPKVVEYVTPTGKVLGPAGLSTSQAMQSSSGGNTQLQKVTSYVAEGGKVTSMGPTTADNFNNSLLGGTYRGSQLAAASSTLPNISPSASVSSGYTPGGSISPSANYGFSSSIKSDLDYFKFTPAFTSASLGSAIKGSATVNYFDRKTDQASIWLETNLRASNIPFLGNLIKPDKRESVLVPQLASDKLDTQFRLESKPIISKYEKEGLVMSPFGGAMTNLFESRPLFGIYKDKAIANTESRGEPLPRIFQLEKEAKNSGGLGIPYVNDIFKKEATQQSKGLFDDLTNLSNSIYTPKNYLAKAASARIELGLPADKPFMEASKRSLDTFFTYGNPLGAYKFGAETVLSKGKNVFGFIEGVPKSYKAAPGITLFELGLTGGLFALGGLKSSTKATDSLLSKASYKTGEVYGGFKAKFGKLDISQQLGAESFGGKQFEKGIMGQSKGAAVIEVRSGKKGQASIYKFDFKPPKADTSVVESSFKDVLNVKGKGGRTIKGYDLSVLTPEGKRLTGKLTSDSRLPSKGEGYSNVRGVIGIGKNKAAAANVFEEFSPMFEKEGKGKTVTTLSTKSKANSGIINMDKLNDFFKIKKFRSETPSEVIQRAKGSGGFPILKRGKTTIFDTSLGKVVKEGRNIFDIKTKKVNYLGLKEKVSYPKYIPAKKVYRGKGVASSYGDIKGMFKSMKGKLTSGKGLISVIRNEDMIFSKSIGLRDKNLPSQKFRGQNSNNLFGEIGRTTNKMMANKKGFARSNILESESLDFGGVKQKRIQRSENLLGGSKEGALKELAKELRKSEMPSESGRLFSKTVSKLRNGPAYGYSFANNLLGDQRGRSKNMLSQISEPSFQFRQRQNSFSVVDIIPAQKSKVRVSQIQDVFSGQQLKTNQITSIASGMTPPTFPILTPPTGLLPPIFFGGGGGGPKGDRDMYGLRTKFKGNYQSSLTANYFNIKAKGPIKSQFTGFEIRGIR